MSLIQTLRTERPRLYRAPDDPAFAFPPPRDAVRKRILKNILADCAAWEPYRPAPRIPERPDSPHPFHQLYITFYTGMEATALIEQFSFAWRLTGDRRWLNAARRWLDATCRWEHCDRLEEHFYTANRYLQALAVALDWLAGALTAEEEARIVACLSSLMTRWWPDVHAQRQSREGGHHAVVDNGHFGVAALQLLGRHPDAEQWVAAVTDRFRAAIMPHGCGPDGEPVDGPTFWGAENMWMLHFGDALRHVTGLDLYRDFPHRLRAPLTWLRYHLAPPPRLVAERYASANANLLTGAGYTQLDEIAPVLLRFAQEAGDGTLRALALREPSLGRMHRLGVGVKNCRAECIYNFGPYAYLFYDPAFQAPPYAATVLPPARVFSMHYGRAALLRLAWERHPVVAVVTGYDGGVTHGFSNLHVQWRGYPALKSISAAEASPVGCGNLPCIGGQNEVVARLGEIASSVAAPFLSRAWREYGASESGVGPGPAHSAGTTRATPDLMAGGREHVRLPVDSPRLHQDYRLLAGRYPALFVQLRRKPRGFRPLLEDDRICVRMDGNDYLQYPRAPHFNPDAGVLRLRVRLHQAPDESQARILFHTGTSVPNTGMGSGVNTFALGFFKSGDLAFTVQSQRYLAVSATLPAAQLQPITGRWIEIVARWGGFNAAGAHPFIELQADGHIHRCDDPALFGELGRDTQGLQSRQTPRVFYIKPNTQLGFGAAVQFPNTGTPCDFGLIELRCPQRDPLTLDFADGLGGETGSAPLEWKLNPTRLLKLTPHEALLGAGPHRIRVSGPATEGVTFARESVPYFPSGLAASSLKRFMPGGEESALRLRIAAAPSSETLTLLFADARAKLRLEHVY